MPKPQLVDANIVVLAQTHNPTIPSRDWLCSKGVFAPEDFQGAFEKQFVHTPAFASCDTPHFRFFVDESRMQIGAKQANEEGCLALLIQKVERYVTHLPETRYTAVGFNLTHTVEFAGGPERTAFSQGRIGKDALGAAMQINETSFEVGLIFVWSDNQARVRVVIEPKKGDGVLYVAQTNVHQVVAQETERVKAVVGHLQRFDQYLKNTEARLSSFFGA